MNTRMLPAALFCLLTGTGLTCAAGASPGPDAVTVYTVQGGENLHRLAERYFKRVPDYREVQRINRIRDPYRIPVGTRIRIPIRLLRQTRVSGYVVSARGKAFVITSKGQRPLKAGDRIAEGDRLVTGPNSFITIRLDAETLVNLPSQSVTAIRLLRKTLLTGRVERLLWLEEGRMKALVPKLREGQDFRIETPVSVSAVRGTEYRVTFNKLDRKAGTEVLNGTVAVQGGVGARAEPVAHGFGIMVRPGQGNAVKPLLAAPIVRSATNNLGGVGLTLGPVDGAVAYHAQAASDEKFIDTVAEGWSKGSELLLLPGEGTPRFVRVSAIDADGLEGLWATRALPPASEANFGITKEGHFRVLGGAARTLRIQIVRDRPNGPVVVDRHGKSIDEVGVTGLASGIYYWRILDIADPSQEWSQPRKLVITRQE